MAYDVPEFCQVEHLGPDGSWYVGHSGISLMNPQAYVNKRKGLTRLILIDSGGKILTKDGVVDPDPCPHCDADHRGPRDGRCLL